MTPAKKRTAAPKAARAATKAARAASPKLSHVTSSGRASMVNVGTKTVTERLARTEGRITMSAAAFKAIRGNAIKKGDVLAVARIAGIQAAKRTADLIPLCHPLALTDIQIELTLDAKLPGVRAECTVRTVGQTGVEMEALTAVSIALLTIYDMAKAIDKSMTISGIRLLEKRGGKSGVFTAGRGR